jgi:hypothetical protein
MGPIDPGDDFLYSESLGSDVEMFDLQEEEAVTSVESSTVRGDPIENTQVDRLVISIDFGTTFSSVAYAIVPRGTDASEINIRDVQCIGNYPGYEPPPGMPDVRQDVPTELWYDYTALNHNLASAHMMGAMETTDSSSGDDSSDSERSQFEEDAELAFDGFKPTTKHNQVHVTQHWGFGVQQRLGMIDMTRDDARPLTRFKLGLDTTELTEDIRTDLNLILQTLVKKKIIRSKSDIYADFLTHLLSHTKDELLLQNILQSNMVVQFVLCVPAKWPMNACRIMQTALEQAVKAVQLSERAEFGVHNLFMISEPEAAAECIFAEEHRDNYILVGNVQVITFQN